MNCRACNEEIKKDGDDIQLCYYCKMNNLYVMSQTNAKKYFALTDQELTTSKIPSYYYESRTTNAAGTRYYVDDVEKLAERIFGAQELTDRRKMKYHKYKDQFDKRRKIRDLIDENKIVASRRYDYFNQDICQQYIMDDDDTIHFGDVCNFIMKTWRGEVDRAIVQQKKEEIRKERRDNINKFMAENFKKMYHSIVAGYVEYSNYINGTIEYEDAIKLILPKINDYVARREEEKTQQRKKRAEMRRLSRELTAELDPLFPEGYPVEITTFEPYLEYVNGLIDLPTAVERIKPEIVDAQEERERRIKVESLRDEKMEVLRQRKKVDQRRLELNNLLSRHFGKGVRKRIRKYETYLHYINGHLNVTANKVAELLVNEYQQNNRQNIRNNTNTISTPEKHARMNEFKDELAKRGLNFKLLFQFGYGSRPENCLYRFYRDGEYAKIDEFTGVPGTSMYDICDIVESKHLEQYDDKREVEDALACVKCVKEAVKCVSVKCVRCVKCEMKVMKCAKCVESKKLASHSEKVLKDCSKLIPIGKVVDDAHKQLLDEFIKLKKLKK